MYKYALMVGCNDAAVLVDADDNKAVKAYIAKGYGIVNHVKAKYPIKVRMILVDEGSERCVC